MATGQVPDVTSLPLWAQGLQVAADVLFGGLALFFVYRQNGIFTEQNKVLAQQTELLKKEQELNEKLLAREAKLEAYDKMESVVRDICNGKLNDAEMQQSLRQLNEAGFSEMEIGGVAQRLFGPDSEEMIMRNFHRLRIEVTDSNMFPSLKS